MTTRVLCLPASTILGLLLYEKKVEFVLTSLEVDRLFISLIKSSINVLVNPNWIITYPFALNSLASSTLYFGISSFSINLWKNLSGG